jgi:hypothetical protein
MRVPDSENAVDGIATFDGLKCELSLPSHD